MDKAQKIKNLIGSEDACVAEYMANGPDGLAAFLGIDRAGELFREIMRYFVFEKNLVFKCAILNIEVVQQIMISVGPMEFRKLMGIEDAAFSGAVFEQIFDIVGLSCKSFYRYVVSHKKELVEMLLRDGPDAMRRYLCVVGEKYDNLWEAVMDLFVEEFSKQRIRARMVEHGDILKKLMPKLQRYLNEKGLL